MKSVEDEIKEMDAVPVKETPYEKSRNKVTKATREGTEIIKSIMIYVVTAVFIAISYIVIMGMPKFEPKEVNDVAFLSVALFAISISIRFTWRKKAQFNATLTKKWIKTNNECNAISKQFEAIGTKELDVKCIEYRKNLIKEIQTDILLKYVDYDFFIKHLQSLDPKSFKKEFSYNEEITEEGVTKTVKRTIQFSKNQFKAIKAAIKVTVGRLDSGVLINKSESSNKKRDIYIGRGIGYYDGWAGVKAVITKGITSISYAYLGWTIISDFTVEKFKFFLMFCLSLIVSAFMTYDSSFQEMLTKVLQKTENRIFYFNELGYYAKNETKETKEEAL